MIVHIYNDNHEIGGANAYGSKDMASNIFLVELKEGDVIWLKCEGNGYMFHAAAHQNTFSGFLLSLST